MHPAIQHTIIAHPSTPRLAVIDTSQSITAWHGAAQTLRHLNKSHFS